MPKAIAPTVIGIFADPGGATVANNAGNSAVIVVPVFCAIAMAVTRARVGNNSG